MSIMALPQRVSAKITTICPAVARRGENPQLMPIEGEAAPMYFHFGDYLKRNNAATVRSPSHCRRKITSLIASDRQAVESSLRQCRSYPITFSWQLP